MTITRNKSNVFLFLLFFIHTCVVYSYNDGIYSGTAMGYEDNINVSVQVKDSKITNVTVTGHKESLPSNSLAVIPEQIIKEQSPEVDAVSGATISSDAIMRAVKDALKKAKSPSPAENIKMGQPKIGKTDSPDIIKLQIPSLKEKGPTLMQALSKRCSSRSFSSLKLPIDILSGLFWAANGVNRLDSGLRTAPSARNWQEIDIYAACEEGLYLYDHKGHYLKLVSKEDLRAHSGKQPFAATAPAVLIYVCNKLRMQGCPQEKINTYAAVDTGFISQNVYLYCAYKNLATVVLGMVDKEALAKKMGLNKNQMVTFTQPVGYNE